MPRIFSRDSVTASPRRTLAAGLVPVSLNVSQGTPGTLMFSDGSSSQTTCLRCPDARCMTFRDEEVGSASLPKFPADRNPIVCPTGAISRTNGGAPSIDPDACMFCGICASRCPAGAIRMIPYAVIDDTASPAFPETDDEGTADIALAAVSSVPRSGEFLTESDVVADELRSRMLAAWNRNGDRFPDLLARNLLIAAGCGAAMRRKGDVSARMDIVLGSPWPEFGCAEAEFGDEAVLDAPRDLLDDIAVAVGRLGRNPRTLLALVVTDVLPNWRSEYWRIIQDIRKVVGVKVGTVTVLALCLLIWRGRKMSELPPNLFHVDIETPSYREAVLEPLLGRKLRIGLAPRPFVEVAK